MTGIRYRTGDATQPLDEGPRFITHIVNDEDKWGSGFVVALSRRWPEPEAMYRMWCEVPVNLSWCQGEGLPKLGNVQYVEVDDDLTVVNMMAQRGVRHSSHAPRAVDYDAVRDCLDKVGQQAVESEATIHMPRIGCGLGGGDWNAVEELILLILVDKYRLAVTVYDLPTVNL